MTPRRSSGMIYQAKRRRLEKHRRDYMGRVDSNALFYFSAALSRSLCAFRSFVPCFFLYVTLFSIHFRLPVLSVFFFFFKAFTRPGTTLRAVCVRTSGDYLLLPLSRNYFQTGRLRCDRLTRRIERLTAIDRFRARKLAEDESSAINFVDVTCNVS